MVLIRQLLILEVTLLNILPALASSTCNGYMFFVSFGIYEVTASIPLVLLYGFETNLDLSFLSCHVLDHFHTFEKREDYQTFQLLIRTFRTSSKMICPAAVGHRGFTSQALRAHVHSSSSPPICLALSATVHVPSHRCTFQPREARLSSVSSPASTAQILPRRFGRLVSTAMSGLTINFSRLFATRSAAKVVSGRRQSPPLLTLKDGHYSWLE